MKTGSGPSGDEKQAESRGKIENVPSLCGSGSQSCRANCSIKAEDTDCGVLWEMAGWGRDHGGPIMRQQLHLDWLKRVFLFAIVQMGHHFSRREANGRRAKCSTVRNGADWPPPNTKRSHRYKLPM